MQRLIWRDGDLIPWEDATVHVLAQSLQRGSLAFDYIGVHQTAKGTAIFRLEDHINRLLNTCAIMGLPIKWKAEELVDAAAATVRANVGAKSVRICALFPSIEVELVPQDPHVAVFIAAYDSRTDIIAGKPGAFHFSPLLQLKIERIKRSRRDDLIPPQAKVAASYTPSMPAKWQARREGYDDIILLDEHDNVTEAPTSNIFLVVDGGLVTPGGDQVLLGITRDSIIALAGAMQIPCTERIVHVDELLTAQEVFMTGTSVGVWPVIGIDRRAIGNGETGEISARLQARFTRVLRGEDDEFGHWLYYV